MTTRTKDTDITPWLEWTDEAPEPGYDADVKASIQRGLADIEAGRVYPAEQVWKDLGIE